MSQVEACPQGVVWGVAYDSTAWVYTGGWGGAHHKPAHSSSAPGSIGPMSDMKYFYIYENQRWNPLSGFSSSGLPTDRYKLRCRNVIFTIFTTDVSLISYFFVSVKAII